MANFKLPYLYLGSPLGVTHLGFRRDLWCQQTSIPGLSYGIVCVILGLAVLVDHRLETDRWTHDDSVVWIKTKITVKIFSQQTCSLIRSNIFTTSANFKLRCSNGTLVAANIRATESS